MNNIISATLDDIQKIYGEAVMPLYKDQVREPFTGNDNGIGYKGVVLYNEIEDKIQCSLCGEWFENVATHVQQLHKISTRGYKEAFDITYKTPLVTRRLSAISSNTAKKTFNRLLQEGKLNVGIKAGGIQVIRAIQRKNGGYNRVSVMNRNKYGSCDAQIAARLKIVIDTQNDFNPTANQIREVDPPLVAILQRRFGTLNKAKDYFKIERHEAGRKPIEGAILLGYLRKFVIENKRLPTQDDFDEKALIHPKEAYLRCFGSWRRAVTMAGVEILLKAVKNKKQEVMRA